MKKEEFLSLLRERLSIFPPEEIERHVGYYGEMIDDHIEDGFPEEKVIETLGSVDDILKVILEETALSILLKRRIKPKRRLKPWEILLCCLLSPVWIPLLITAVVLLWTLYIVLWTLVICMYAIELSFAVGAIGGAAVAVILLFVPNTFASGVLFGGGLICAGLMLLFLPLCLFATKGTWKLAKKIVLAIKFLIIGKGNKK